MKRKTKNTLTGICATILALGALAGGLALLTNGFKEFDMFGIKEVDNSRVAITTKGTRGSKSVATYVFFDHPDLEFDSNIGTWPGIVAKDVVGTDGYDYVTDNEDGTYTIELTSILPLGYEDFGLFIKEGGTCGVVISYGDEESRIQSKDFFIEESGNHHLTLPTHNKGDITDTIVKFYKETLEDDETKEDEKKESTSNEVEEKSDVISDEN
ncbi:MAG: hypothetical protein J1F32_01815 [Erysipelotrichales bacterium]|nr:hypothetical protein [Erysipelotrichales bacterium]